MGRKVWLEKSLFTLIFYFLTQKHKITKFFKKSFLFNSLITIAILFKSAIATKKVDLVRKTIKKPSKCIAYKDQDEDKEEKVYYHIM